MFDMVAGGIVGLCRGSLLQPDGNHEDLMRQKDNLSQYPQSSFCTANVSAIEAH